MSVSQSRKVCLPVILCLVLASATGGSGGEAAATTTTVVREGINAESYRRCVIDFGKCEPPTVNEAKFNRSNPHHEVYRTSIEALKKLSAGAVTVTLAAVDGKLVQSWANVRRTGSQFIASLISPTFEFDGKSLKGRIYVRDLDKSWGECWSRGQDWLCFTIDAAIEGAEIKGSWKATCEPGKLVSTSPSIGLPEVSGSLTGKVMTRGDLDKLHPFFPDSEFPCYGGPDRNGTSKDIGQPLADDLFKEGRLVWTSEDIDLPGSYSLRNGGFGGVVLADGRIYFGFQRPDGKHASKADLEKFEEGAKSKRFGRMSEYWWLKTYGPLEFRDENLTLIRDHFSHTSDDVLLCMDARTGLTLWKLVTPSVSKNMNCIMKNGKGGRFSTPCVADGRVVMVGDGYMHCADARSGKILWRVLLPSRAENPDRPGRNGAYQSSPFIADKTVVIWDHKLHGGSLFGYDVESGAQKWKMENAPSFVRGYFTMPWRHEGKTYIIQGNHLIDPETGKTLWKTPGGRGQPCLSGDILVVGHGPGHKNEIAELIKDEQKARNRRGLTACRVTLEKPERLWSNDCTLYPSGPLNFTIYKDRIHTMLTKPSKEWEEYHCCIDLKTGEILWKARAARSTTTFPMMVAADGRVLTGGQHPLWIRADGANSKILHSSNTGDLNYGYAPCTPMALCGGRLYMRGRSRIICYDVRKHEALEGIER